jgi:subtilase family serine protease
MLVGQTQTFSDGAYYDEYRIGGTSLSSPLMAGIMALAQQRAGHPIGFANPALYSAYSASSGFVHDVLPSTGLGVVRVDYANGENATDGLLTSLRLLGYDQVLTIHARPGYDDVTGLGSPKGTTFLDAVAAASH